MKGMKDKKLSRNAGIAMIIGGDILLLLLGWFMLISPQRATADSIRLQRRPPRRRSWRPGQWP